MIISFKVRNFKSIKDEQILNLEVENLNDVHSENIAYLDAEKKTAALRTIAIFGANASGKSNIIAALEALQEFVVESTKNELDEPIAQYQPFKLSDDTMNAPTLFELEFTGKDELRYIYTVEFTKTAVIREALYYYPSAKPAKLFDRTPEIAQPEWFGKNLTGAKVMSSLLEHQLYLSVAAQHAKSSEQLKNVYRYIRDDINFISPYDSLFATLNDESYRSVLAKLLACADTGITAVGVKDAVFDENKLPSEMPDDLKKHIMSNFKYQPIFYHNSSKAGFTIKEESGGTKRLYEIAPAILMGLNFPEVFVIDELDCSLHPRIVELIIRLFNDPAVNKKNPQLIFVSHNTNLMNEDYLRRDQIYFTKKDKNGATEFYCLDEFNPIRSDTNFEKWYLEGRFEAIPDIQYAELKKVIQSMPEKMVMDVQNG